MICPLCQHRFVLSEAACVAGCPLRGACHVICCPHCHYRFVEESSVVALAARAARWTRRSLRSASRAGKRLGRRWNVRVPGCRARARLAALDVPLDAALGAPEEALR
jgi:hypothetical protein